MITQVLKVSPENPDKKKIFFGATILKKGGIVAFPTETVYGLAANLLKKEAIDKLYKVKRRSRNKPFTVHISDLNMIEKMGCEITGEAKVLIDRFWPGPLTIILSTEDNKKIGFRMPSNRVALELIRKANVPIVAPSANISGKAPPRDPKEVLRYFNGKIDVLLDGGPTEIGIESTVLDLTVTPPRILREGAIKVRNILKIFKHG